MECCYGARVRLVHLLREEHGEAGVEVMRRVTGATQSARGVLGDWARGEGVNRG